MTHCFDVAPPLSVVPQAAPATETLRTSTRFEDLPLTILRVGTDTWDHTVPDFDDVCQEQTYVFASRRWPSASHEPVIFSADSTVVGGALVMIQPILLGFAAIAVINRGPMLRDAQGTARTALHSAMIDLLVREYAERRGMMLAIQPPARPLPEDAVMRSLATHRFVAGSMLPYPNRYLVNLQLDDDEQRRSLHQKWRYHLAKSEQERLTFERAGHGDLARFAALYQAMSNRKRFPDHSAYHTLPALLKVRQDALRPELFFVHHEGEPVAGAAIFKAGHTAAYLYGATSERALQLRAGYFLHWQIIRWLKRHTRAQWYDLGGNDGFHGLHQFKSGLVGQAGVISPMPSWQNLAASRLSWALGRGAFAARDVFHTVRRLIHPPWDGRARPDLEPGVTRSR